MVTKKTDQQTDRKLQVDAIRLIHMKILPKWKKRNNFVVVETWILFRENDEVVSNVIQEAYEHYEAIEFGRHKKNIGDPNRHIKLINIAGKKVMFAGFAHKKHYIFDIDKPVYLLLSPCGWVQGYNQNHFLGRGGGQNGILRYIMAYNNIVLNKTHLKHNMFLLKLC